MLVNEHKNSIRTFNTKYLWLLLCACVKFKLAWLIIFKIKADKN